jgi:hypothetical protein
MLGLRALKRETSFKKGFTSFLNYEFTVRKTDVLDTSLSFYCSSTPATTTNHIRLLCEHQAAVNRNEPDTMSAVELNFNNLPVKKTPLVGVAFRFTYADSLHHELDGCTQEQLKALVATLFSSDSFQGKLSTATKSEVFQHLRVQDQEGNAEWVPVFSSRPKWKAASTS